ncbi:hypothetical protein ACET4H_19495 [Pseudomonas aeruginosa]
MIRQFFVWFGGLVTMALIYWAAVILHGIGGYHVELTPIIATVGAPAGSRSSVMSLATALGATRRWVTASTQMQTWLMCTFPKAWTATGLAWSS